MNNSVTMIQSQNVTLLETVTVNDFTADGNNEDCVAKQAREKIKTVLEQGPSHLISSVYLWERQLDARTIRFRHRVRELLSQAIPMLRAAVKDLEAGVDKVLEELVTSLVGSKSFLRAGVRARLRAELMTDTWPVWFPYRTVLGTLNFTQGAWDRVLLTFTGSAPSLFISLMTAARNIRDTREFSAEIQDGVRQRLLIMVRDRLHPLAEDFSRALNRSVEGINNAPPSESFHQIDLTGIEELQHKSTRIFEDKIQAQMLPSYMVQAVALIGFFIFWFFFSSPIAALYQQYWYASQDLPSEASTLEAVPALIQAYWYASQDLPSEAATIEKLWERFPAPSASMLITSLLLSLLPMMAFCMVFLTVFLRRKRIERCVAEIYESHTEEIERMKEKGILRLEFKNPVLEQARFLLSV
jgi:hypothetical protein